PYALGRWVSGRRSASGSKSPSEDDPVARRRSATQDPTARADPARTRTPGRCGPLPDGRSVAPEADPARPTRSPKEPRSPPPGRSPTRGRSGPPNPIPEGRPVAPTRPIPRLEVDPTRTPKAGHARGAGRVLEANSAIPRSLTARAWTETNPRNRHVH